MPITTKSALIFTIFAILDRLKLTIRAFFVALRTADYGTVMRLHSRTLQV